MRILFVLLALWISTATAQASLARTDKSNGPAECDDHAAAIARGALQPRRVALTIGNNVTKDGNLQNAVNDARLVASTLRELEWEVQETSDVSREAFIAALQKFSIELAKLCEDDVALSYYAGNGIEIAQVSYLASTDTQSAATSATKESETLASMVSLAMVLTSLEAHAGAKIVIVDTCRDDPFAASRKSVVDTSTVVRYPRNTLVAHAAEIGEQALDNGPNPQFGPYSWALSRALKEPGLVAEEVFRRVRLDVVAWSKDKGQYRQSPFVSSTLTNEIFLGKAPAKRAVAASRPPAVAVPETEDAGKPVDGKRIALVVANFKYGAISELDNPPIDAREISDKLTKLGFQVTSRENLTLSLLNKALRDFGDAAETADWALLYFAGHGMELSGRTFILPTDVELQQDRHASEEAIQIERLIDKVENAKYLDLIVLDACRNNPFLKRMKRTGRLPEVALGRGRSADSSVGLGMAQIDKAGVLVAYSARHGTEAFDGEPGKLSPFAAALTDEMAKPGVEVQMVFRRVRDRVMEITGQQQEPFSYGSLPGREFYFKQAISATATSGR